MMPSLCRMFEKFSCEEKIPIKEFRSEVLKIRITKKDAKYLMMKFEENNFIKKKKGVVIYETLTEEVE